MEYHSSTIKSVSNKRQIFLVITSWLNSSQKFAHQLVIMSHHLIPINGNKDMKVNMLNFGNLTVTMNDNMASGNENLIIVTL